MKYLQLNKNIKLFLLVIFLFGLTSSAFNGFLGIYVKEIGYDEAVVGSLLSWRRLSVAFSAILMAILASRLGRKQALQLGLILMGVGGIGIVLTENMTIMYLMAVVYGVGQSTLMTFEAPLLYENTVESERVYAFSASFAARNAAFMTGSLGTGLLADFLTNVIPPEAMGVRYALVLISTMTFVAMIPLLMMHLHEKEKPKPLSMADIPQVLNRKVVWVFIYTAIIGFGAGMIVPFFGVFLKYQLSVADTVVGVILAISQLGTVLGGLSVPLLSKKFGKAKTVILVQMLSIPFLMLIGINKSIILVTIAFFFRSSLMNMAHPLIQNLYMELVPAQNRALVNAMRSSANNLSRAGGIFIGGLMMKSISYSAPYAVTIVCYLLGSSLFFFLFAAKKKHALFTGKQMAS